MQTQKHNLKINQIITKKKEKKKKKKKKKKKRKRKKPSNPSGLRWGRRRAAAEQKARLGIMNTDSTPAYVLQSMVEQAIACSFSVSYHY